MFSSWSHILILGLSMVTGGIGADSLFLSSTNIGGVRGSLDTFALAPNSAYEVMFFLIWTAVPGGHHVVLSPSSILWFCSSIRTMCPSPVTVSSFPQFVQGG